MRTGICTLIATVAVFCAAARSGEAMAVDDAVAQLKGFDYGKDTKALRALDRAVGAATNDPQEKAKMAERLASVLADAQASDATRLYCCQQLEIVGSDAQVPLLTKMLDEAKTIEMARGTLQRIGTEAARNALRAAMEKAQGDAQVGLVNSLGLLRDEKAAETIAKLLASADGKVGLAAAKALARIGNAAAATALTQAKAATKAPAAEFTDAQLGCAERLVASGDKASAGTIYQQLWGKDSPALVRIAALRGLVSAKGADALPAVSEAMADGDATLQAAATALLAQVPGPAATAAMAAQLGKLKPPALAAMIDALADRGDKSACGAVAALVDSAEATVSVAAVKALGKLGDATTVETLARIAGGQGKPAEAARGSLARLSGQGVDAAILTKAEKGTPAERAALIGAAADRRIADATPLLLKALDADEPVRVAAVDAMLVIGSAPECYPKLIGVVQNSKAPADNVEKAMVAVASRLPEGGARVDPVLAALKDAKPAAKVSFIRILRGLSGPEALGAVRAALADTDATVKDAAVRALADWSDQSPAADLLELMKGGHAPDREQVEDAARYRVLALRGYLRMARAAKGGSAEQLQMLQQVAQVATTSDAKKLLLGGLGDIADAGALQFAAGMLADESVQAEARIAVTKIAGAMAKASPASAREAVDKVSATIKDKAFVDQLVATLESGNKPAADEQTALRPDAKRSDEIKKLLAKRAPQGFHLACYLDCGADKSDGAKGGPVLAVGDAKGWFWPDADKAAHFRFGSVWYAGEAVPFEAAGLAPTKAYQLGFSWWDFDGNGRVQSVALAPGKGGDFKEVLKATKLPNFKDSQEAPAEFTAAVPPNLYADGSLRIAFRQNGQGNVVVSEVWLWEAGEGSAKDVKAQAAETPKEDAKPPAADKPVEIKRGKAEGGRTTKILIVTGIDYPGHPWQKTAPAVAEELAKDPRLLVDVAEDPKILCSPEINDYAAIIIHFMNWEKPDPGEKARANLKAFVEGGKGMILTHFACGAFQDGGTPWPEFAKLAGRGWDRKMRGHDPYGKFQVRMTDVKHPITDGLQPFDVTDELYTCLGGDTPITTIVTATSKVDKKDYPIAFVLEPGKGKVFHCVLGHDAQVWRTPGAAELLRRGVAWSAGIAPVAK